MGIIKNLKEEVRIIKERDPAIHSSMEVLLYPSFKVMLHYRLAHKLYLSGHYFWARYISQRGVRKTGIEIHPGAQIGKGFFIDHGNGVIIPQRLPVAGDTGQGIAAACLLYLHGNAADDRQRTTIEGHKAALAAFHISADSFLQLSTGHGALESAIWGV